MPNNSKIQTATTRYSSVIIILIVAVGVILRFMLAMFPYNYDFGSYLIVGELVSKGRNVYAHTFRYNYSPLFSLIQGLFYNISGSSAVSAGIYRTLFVLLMTSADIIAFIYIIRKRDLLCGAFFFLNPITIITSGYLLQFDILAVVPAFMAAEYMRHNTSGKINRKDAAAVILLSLSLTVKHLLFVFPAWILMSKRLSMKRKALFAFVPPAVFLASFLPYVSTGMEGIIRNVFLYRSFANFPIMFSGLIKTLTGTDNPFSFPLFVVLMVITGYLLRNEETDKLMACYFIALVCFSSAVANHYLAIPCIAIAILAGPTLLPDLYSILLGIFLLLNFDGLNLFDVIISEIDNKYLGNLITGLSLRDIMYPIACYLLLGILISYMKEKRIFDPPAKQMKKN